jgi:hypothetical protein
MQTHTRKNKAERRNPRFSGVTKGIRLRNDQMEALDKIFIMEPELDWSKVIRQGLDMWLRSYHSQNQPLFRNIPAPRDSSARSTSDGDRRQRS